MRRGFFILVALISVFTKAYSIMPDLLENHQEELGEYYEFLHKGLSLIDDGRPNVLVQTTCSSSSDFLEACKDGATTYVFAQYALENQAFHFISDINGASVAKSRKGYKKLFGKEPSFFLNCELTSTLASFPSYEIDLGYFVVTEDSFKGQYQSLKQITTLLKRVSPKAVILIDFQFPKGAKVPLIERYLIARGWKSEDEGQKKVFFRKSPEIA